MYDIPSLSETMAIPPALEGTSINLHTRIDAGTPLNLDDIEEARFVVRRMKLALGKQSRFNNF